MSDLIGVLESAYRAELSDEAWLRAVMTEALPFLDRGFGLSGFFFDLSRSTPFWGEVSVGERTVGPGVMIGATVELSASVLRRAAARVTLVGTSSETMGFGARLSSLPGWRRWFGPYGIKDGITINAIDARGKGCLVAAPCARTESLSGAVKATWERIATHMAAGNRLRLAAPLASAPSGPPDAVLTPDGKVEHAETPARGEMARASLGAGVRGMVRARGRMRRQAPDDAVEKLWRALCAGRWSLLDQFDADGRRYVLARRNDPSLLGDGSALTERERMAASCAALGHSNKVIAYELGIATSTVGTLLARAAGKLGVSSRARLIAAVQARQASGPTKPAAPPRSPDAR